MKIDGSRHCGNITYEADVNLDNVYILQNERHNYPEIRFINLRHKYVI